MRGGETLETELLAAIVAEPDAREPRLVYADSLIARGDPLGELAILDDERRARPDDRALAARWEELEPIARAAVVADWPRLFVGGWWLGFVDVITLSRRLLNDVRARGAWFTHPALAVVRSLLLPSPDDDAWRLLATWPGRVAVRTLRHATLEQELSDAAAAAIASVLPGLTAFELTALRVPTLGPLAALPLTSLRVHVSTLDLAGCDELAALPPSVRELALRFPEARAAGPLLARLCAPGALPGLRELELTNVSPAEALDALAHSGRLATLDRLALDVAYLSPEDHARIAAHREALARIELVAPRGSSIDGYLGELLHDTLGRTSEAFAAFDRAPVGPQMLRAHGRALRVQADPVRIERAIDRLFRRHRAADRDVGVLVAAAIGDDPAPARVLREHAARSQLMIGYAQDALAAALADPASPGLRAVACLAALAAGNRAIARRELAALAERAERPAEAALGWLVEGTFATRVPRTAVTPAEIHAAVLAAVAATRGAPLAEPAATAEQLRLCAEIAIVGAAWGHALPVAVARARALANLLDDGVRPLHHDLRVAVAVMQLERTSYELVTDLVFATRGPDAPSALDRLARRAE